MAGTEIQMLYGFIAVRVILLYLSTTISSNIMTQIYTERVLINGEEPPILRNQILLFVVVDIMLNLLFCGVIAFIDKMGDGDDYPLTTRYVSQYGISLVVLVILALIISNTMYNKKYFLYKDDGLRAIRALSEMVLRIGALVSLVPFFLAVEPPTEKSCKKATNAAASAATANMKSRVAIAQTQARVRKELGSKT